MALTTNYALAVRITRLEKLLSIILGRVTGGVGGTAGNLVKHVGDPNGFVEGNIGDVCVDISDPAAQKFWFKDTDGGTSGWH